MQRNRKYILSLLILLMALVSLKGMAQLLSSTESLQPYVIIVQPIVFQGDDGKDPASFALPEELVDKAYENAGIDFLFLEPLTYNSTKARDGLINLNEICKQAEKDGYLRGQGDIVNMFFVNAVDGHKGPLGRGMLNGSITFIALGDSTKSDYVDMQAFVIGHEVAHNLGLGHVVDDPEIHNDVPNLMGDGAFKDRIGPKALIPSQIEVIMNSPLVRPRVDLLSVEQGKKAILDESFEPYFSNLQKREVSAFTSQEVPFNDIDKVRDFAKEKFQEAVLGFTKEETVAISWMVGEINKELLESDFDLMANQPFRFIKISDWLCGGFGHTRGTFIILGESYLKRLMTKWNQADTKEKKQELLFRFSSLVVHEQMHVLQRTFPTRFEYLYTNLWDFVKAEVDPEESIIVNQVSNPDAPLAHWLIKDEKNANIFFWPRTLLKEGIAKPVMGRDFEDKVFQVHFTENHFYVAKSADGEMTSMQMKGFPEYTSKFPVSRGIDHPNEISAYMFADVFVANLKGVQPFVQVTETSKKNIQSFLKWLSSEMH